MYEVCEYWQRDLTEPQARSIATLAAAAFPDSRRDFDQRLRFMLDAAGSEDPEQRESKRLVIWKNEAAVAHARIFSRMIHVADRVIKILALATVCCKPEMRGQGLGRAIVKAALPPVDDSECEFSLFQTGVPRFYEQLNCRIIQNRIINRRNATAAGKSPFGEKYVMVYPDHRHWPEGVVDLNGEGF